MTTLTETDDSLAYTVGRTAGWVVELLIVYLVLSFPSGRLADRVDRLLAGAMAAVVAVLYGLQLAIADHSAFPARTRAASTTAQRTRSSCSSASRRSWMPS